MKLFRLKVKKPTNQYIIISFKGNIQRVEQTLALLDLTHNIIYLDDYKGIFQIKQTREKTKMTDNVKKKFKVVDLPNNTKRIENLLNEYANKGYKIVWLNDYSIVFSIVGGVDND